MKRRIGRKREEDEGKGRCEGAKVSKYMQRKCEGKIEGTEKRGKLRNVKE